MTSQLVHQRIRNRIIEVLEWMLESEKRPPTLGFNEVINSWEEWAGSPLHENQFPFPIYTQQENALLREVSSAVDAFCEATPGSITDDEQALRMPEWSLVVSAARFAFVEMMKRGKLSENEEIPL